MSYTLYETIEIKKRQNIIQSQNNNQNRISSIFIEMARYYQTPNQRPVNHPNQEQRQSNNQPPVRGNQNQLQNNQSFVPVNGLPVQMAFKWPMGRCHYIRREKKDDHKIKLWKTTQRQDKELFDDFHPYGLVFFSNQILSKEAIHLFHSEIIMMLRLQSWNINVNSHDDAFMWERRFELMRECQINFLGIKLGESVKTNYLLNFIEPIGFPDLMILDLYKVNIDNIEPLSNLNAPRLTKINLIYNRIYSSKALNKSVFSLKHLYLISTTDQQSKFIKKNKPYTVLDNFSRWNFCLEDLRLEKNDYNSVGMNDLRFLAKSQFPKQLSQLRINIARKNRIKQNQLILKFNHETNVRFQIFQPIIGDLFLQNNLTREDLLLYTIRI